MAGDVEKKEDTRSGVLQKGCVSKGCKECFVHRVRIRSEYIIMLIVYMMKKIEGQEGISLSLARVEAHKAGFYLDLFTWGGIFPPHRGGSHGGGNISQWGGIACMRFATYFEMVN